MKMKNLIWSLVVIFSVVVLLASYLIYYKPSERNESYPVLSAIPVFYSNSTITSENEALIVFNQYFDKIIQNTKEKLPKYEGLSEEVIQEMNFFNEFVAVEKRGWNSDKYWLGPNKLAYVFTVPAVSKYEKWEKRQEGIFVERIKCKGLQPGQLISVPAETTTYEEVKKYFNNTCPEGIEIYWKKTESEIKYLMDNNGVVYWAGQNLVIKPWFVD